MSAMDSYNGLQAMRPKWRRRSPRSPALLCVVALAGWHIHAGQRPVQWLFSTPVGETSAPAAAGESLPPRRQVIALTAAGLAALSEVDAALADKTNGIGKLAVEYVANDAITYFAEYEEALYDQMRDDGKRTSAFIKAIVDRLKENPGKLSVLDIGTGPFATFACAAARNGAKKVYAMEGNIEAARFAQGFVQEAEKREELPKDVVEVIEGFSTELNLTEKVDIVVADIFGPVVTEENVILTLLDAQARFMKDPSNPNSYIPASVQTLAAPVSYALHPVVTNVWDRIKGRPLRLDGRETVFQLLSDPQVVEDISFAKLKKKNFVLQNSLSFNVTDARLDKARNEYFTNIKQDQLNETEANAIARGLAESYSGFAFWPRLVMDPKGKNVLETRGPGGKPEQSYWRTLLTLTCPGPIPVKPGTVLKLDETAELPRNVVDPVKYTLKVSGL